MKPLYNKLHILAILSVACCTTTTYGMHSAVDTQKEEHNPTSSSMNRIHVLLKQLDIPHDHEIESAPQDQIVVWTDYEGDDSVGCGLFLKCARDHGINVSDNVMIGVLLSNQYRKKALAQTLVTLFEYNPNIVCAGTGGIKEPFEEEGKNILSQELLDHFLSLDKKYLQSNDPTLYQDDESSTRFKKMLGKAALNSIDVILLTNPIDFVKALEGKPQRLYKIKSIYMMGGWFDGKPSFNWGLNMESVITLFELMDAVKGHPNSPKLTLFSSHFFAREFNGYINQKKFPDIIKAFDANPHPIVAHFRHMIKNWDDSMTVIKDYHTDYQKKWRLEMVDRIGKENIGRQFAPADPATMLGYLYPEKFITKKTPSALHFSMSVDSNGKKSFTVAQREDISSNIYVVDTVDMSFFNTKLVELMSISSPK